MSKRVIDGIAYNTETSTLIASTQDACGNESGLYQTRSGAFFVHEVAKGTRPHASGDVVEEIRENFDLLTAKQAENWAANIGGTIYVSPLSDASMRFRTTRAFRDALEAAAKEKNLSMNAFMQRALEQALRGEHSA